jgi:hypothetical protein
MDAKVADLQQQLEKIANEMRRDEKDAARKLDEAAGSIRDKRIREKIRYTKGALQGAGSQYARGMEEEIGANLEALQKKINDAAGAVGKASKQGCRGACGPTRHATWSAVWNPCKADCRTAKGSKGKDQGQGKEGQQGKDGQQAKNGQQGQDGQQGKEGQQGQGQSQGQQSQADRTAAAAPTTARTPVRRAMPTAAATAAGTPTTSASSAASSVSGRPTRKDSVASCSRPASTRAISTR